MPITLHPVFTGEMDAWLGRQVAEIARWVTAQGFKAEGGEVLPLPARDGELRDMLVGVEKPLNLWGLGALPFRLAEGEYVLDEQGLSAAQVTELALGWQLGSYQFTRYRKPKRQPATLLPPKSADMGAVRAMAEAVALVRDLINTPPADMMPQHLAEAARKVGTSYKADVRVIEGKDLLKENYPAIYTVGQASGAAPCLIDLQWGDKKHPKVTLVGKGVCFDTGGLDIKNSANMKLMKKDMGGAAHALALAQLVMGANLPVRLRVLVPAVENAVGANAYRTSDVITMRSGLTVEVGNTDAEGRLVLADALAEAAAEKPDLLVDFATLTGAARTALGTEIPALFSNDDALAQALMRAGREAADPLWQLPLWQDYKRLLKSSIADSSSTGNDSYGGAIIAALFLEQFVADCPHWVHIDLMAWNLVPRPGRPEGGEAMGLRALFRYLREIYR